VRTRNRHREYWARTNRTGRRSVACQASGALVHARGSTTRRNSRIESVTSTAPASIDWAPSQGSAHLPRFAWRSSLRPSIFVSQRSSNSLASCIAIHPHLQESSRVIQAGLRSGHKSTTSSPVPCPVWWRQHGHISRSFELLSLTPGSESCFRLRARDARSIFSPVRPIQTEESASAAHVAYANKTPFIAFRSLSDLAGAGAGANEIGTFFQLASDNSAAFVKEFLKRLA
jgi:hypothetical protein